MIAGVAELSEVEEAAVVLSGHSYVHAPHRLRALWFHKPASPDLAHRTHHLHLTEPGSDLWLRLAGALGDDIGAYTAAKRDPVTPAEPGHRQSVARVLVGGGIDRGPRRPS
jgi:hypothetical protein